MRHRKNCSHTNKKNKIRNLDFNRGTPPVFIQETEKTAIPRGSKKKPIKAKCELYAPTCSLSDLLPQATSARRFVLFACIFSRLISYIIIQKLLHKRALDMRWLLVDSVTCLIKTYITSVRELTKLKFNCSLDLYTHNQLVSLWVDCINYRPVHP